ncbi:STAS/SEC14 domain-containing protein OS=Rhizobacter sp. Root404 OX=1736528 GN=ASC76_07850 PE=4 SV=1 [Rhizobacter fulvus]|jgi:hypothetical protein
MTYTFETTEADGLMTVRLGGERPTESADAARQLSTFWQDVARRSRERQLRAVLAIVEARGDLSSDRVLRWFKQVAGFGFAADTRIAVVIPDRRSRSIVDLGVHVAAEAGLQIGLFDSEPAARDWLALSKAPDRPAGRPLN